MIRILVVEDEKHTARHLVELLNSHPKCKVVQQEETISGVIEYLRNQTSTVDLIFLDIQLADGPSFEIFKQVKVEKPIVYCTAYDQYGIEAIHHNGIGYVLKPFRETQVFNAIENYISLPKLFSADSINDKSSIDLRSKVKEKWAFHYREKTFLVETKEIYLFYIEYEQVFVHTTIKNKLHTVNTLEQIQKQLDSKEFFRINRQMIVQRHAIQ